MLEAARDSGKPAVGHNLAFDLAYSLHSFAQELPGSWEQYKQLVGRWFPGGIYDTKHLAGGGYRPCLRSPAAAPVVAGASPMPPTSDGPVDRPHAAPPFVHVPSPSRPASPP